jgi:ankyrin repeat protein
MSRIDRELRQATEENNLREVRRLLSVGADVNAKDTDGITPLLATVLKGLFAIFRVLVEHGADTEAMHSSGLTTLHFAVMMGNLALVNELVSPNDSNYAPTILGKRKSRRGANVDAKDKDGSTPLHFASICGHSAIAQALLAVGVDILAANNYGRLPIDYAVSERKSAVSKYLLQQLYATTRRLPLHAILEDLTWIVNHDIGGVPPLRTALDENVLVTDDVVEILEYLVNLNPELLSSRDQDGSLPLHHACRRGAPFIIVQSLVNLYKASVKRVTSQGDLPLFLACEMPKTSLDTIFLLMKLYPDLVYR